jgi:carotenoid 1,2-hydratase
MTERGASALHRSVRCFEVGKSRLAWRDDRLHVDIDEVTVPIPRRLKGSLVIEPTSANTSAFSIDREGRHIWQPIAPHARIEVRLSRPALSWSGLAYVDSNRGSEPLAQAFQSWTWSRTVEARRTRVFYDVVYRNTDTRSLALAFASGGGCTELIAPPIRRLDRTFWGLRRHIRSQAGAPPRLIAPFEDGPFYARALVEQHLEHESVLAVHETLSLDRFASRWVQALLPFRMPRRAR